MKKRWLVFIPLLILLLYLGASWYFSDQIILSKGDSLAEDQQTYGDPAQNGLPASQEVQLAANGETLAGWLVVNPGAHCGLLFYHGYGDTRYMMLAYAKMFRQYHCTMLLMDIRGFGASTGRYHTYGNYESKDTLAELDWFEQQTGLADHQIGLVGVSYGASTVLISAASRRDLAFVLADSPYASMTEIVTYQAVQQFSPAIQIMSPGAFVVSGVRAGFNPWSVSPAASAAAIQSPAFLLQEKNDRFIPSAMSQTIYNQIPGSAKELHLVEWSGEHAQSIRTNPQEYQALVTGFLAKFVPNLGLP